MPNKLAIDWDETELRLVAAQCSGGKVSVTDATVIPLDKLSVNRVLRDAIAQRGLQKVATMVAIGRGKAELRELQLPPVPDDELPDMVRFQAIRSFASAGDSATVDFLVTSRTAQEVQLVAAAVTPQKLKQVIETCSDADLVAKRIALRPLAAAALFLTDSRQTHSDDIVLIDLLSEDAEIVVSRAGEVIFMRTVRMPSDLSLRPDALAGELRRSLVACGASGQPDRVIIWGRESVHQEEVARIAAATGSPIDVIDPFDMVQVDQQAINHLPEHVGRLAPLVGLLVVDESSPQRLIDFLNPRRRAEVKPNYRRRALLIGIPVLAALLIGWLAYQKLRGLDQQIAQLETAKASLVEPVKQAEQSVLRTERVDQFLDGDMNWLAELRALAESMPPADQLLLKSISGQSDPRTNLGTLTLAGSVTEPAVIDKLESSVRDEFHQVMISGTSEAPSADAFRLQFGGKLTILPAMVRAVRYQRILEAAEQPPANEADSDEAISQEVQP